MYMHAKVMHHRHHPKQHRFCHTVFYLWTDLVLLSSAKSYYGLLGLGKRRMLSLRPQQFKQVNESPKAWLTARLTKHGIHTPLHRARILAMPERLGYVFNPVCFWCCYNDTDQLFAVVCDVHNTFGEQHSYVCQVAEDQQWVTAEKVFHVSPFLPVEGQYRFCFEIKADRIAIKIHWMHNSTLQLATSITGKLHPINPWVLCKQCLWMPVYAFKVMALIHYHALRLWLKKIRFYRKPPQRAYRTSGTCPAAGLSGGRNIQD